MRVTSTSSAEYASGFETKNPVRKFKAMSAKKSMSIMNSNQYTHENRGASLSKAIRNGKTMAR